MPQKIKTYYLNLGGAPCTDSSRDLFLQRRANIKTTQILYYAKGVDLRYAEYWIQQGAMLLYLN